MNRSVGPPLLHRLQWLAAVLDELEIHRVDLAGRRQHRDQARNGVQELVRPALAFAQGVTQSLDFLSERLACGLIRHGARPPCVFAPSSASAQRNA